MCADMGPLSPASLRLGAAHHGDMVKGKFPPPNIANHTRYPGRKLSHTALNGELVVLNPWFAMVSIACKRGQLKRLLRVPAPQCTSPPDAQDGLMKREEMRMLCGWLY